nr:hypothetical protein [uncultured Friedmanniella sp.]
MSTAFTLSLLGVLGVLLALRLVLPGLPLPALARRLRAVDAILVAVGIVGLAVHCAAMFATPVVLAVPGAGPVVAVINALGWGSVVLFLVPAGLLVAGLRRQLAWAWIGLAALLTAVGITMYNGGPLSTHLVTIAATVAWLGLIGAFLVAGVGPSRPVRPAGSA